MYLFAVRANTQPGKTEEFAQKWKDFYSSRKTVLEINPACLCSTGEESATVLRTCWEGLSPTFSKDNILLKR